MSRIGIDLSDCCNYLASNKKTERRKRIEELKLLLDGELSPELLNKNSETKTGVSWNSIFTSLHLCVLKEAESYCDEKAKNRGKVLPATDKALKASCGLLVQVVTKANADQPLLPCQEVFSCILQIFETAISDDNLLNSKVGETYVNVLTSALSCDKYWGEITFDTWKDLRTLVLNLIMKTSSEKVKANLLNIFNVILLQGGRLSPLIVKSKKLLTAFPEVLQSLSAKQYSNVELNCLYVIHTICLQFGKEFRLSIYNFIDKVLPYIMALNDNRSADIHFKEMVACVLIEMVGIRLTDRSWLAEASSILAFAEKELSDVSRHRLSLPPRPQIVRLAVKLLKQLHSEKSGGASEEYEDPSAKRRKVSTPVSRILESIAQHKENPWPWLSYLDYLLERAPEAVGSDDATAALSFLSAALPATADCLSLSFLTRSSTRLLYLCKTNHVVVNEKYVQDLVVILWSTVHRGLYRGNLIPPNLRTFLNHSVTLEFLLSLKSVTSPGLTDVGLQLASHLIPDWLSHDSLKVLLDLFIDRKIPLSGLALSTLLHLTVTPVISSSRTRLSLVRWCLSGETTGCYSADCLLRLLTRSKLQLPENKSQHQSPLLPLLTPTELFLSLTSEFGLPPPGHLIDQTNVSASSIQVESQDKVLQEDKETCDNLLPLLVDHLERINSLTKLLSFTTFLCELQQLFCKYNVSLKNRLTEFLLETVDGLLPRVSEELETANSQRISPLISYISDFFHCLSLVSKTDKIEQLENIYVSLIKHLTESLKKNANKMNGISTNSASIPSCEVESATDDETRNTKREETKFPEVVTVQAILNLIDCLPDDEKPCYFVKILNFCTNNLILTSKSGFRVAVKFTKHLVSSKLISLVLIRDVLKLELKLLKRWFSCYHETLKLLDLLSDTASPTFRNDESSEITPEIHHMFFQILSHFAQHICSKKYGPQIISKFLYLLSRTIQVDQVGKEAVETSEGKQSPILYFLSFLNHQFHEVRMKAGEFLPVLFSTELCLTKKSGHQIAFTCALKAVSDLFIVKDGKSPETVREEGLNRSGCALFCLLGLITSAHLWRRKALYHLFKIISTKNISPSIFRKVHLHLERSLKVDNVVSFLEQNLDYVLWSWYMEFKDFQKFPYLFMNYESLPAFLKEYKTIIVTILLENNDLEGFDSFCDLLGSSGLDVAKSCFSEMIACLLPKTSSADLNQAKDIHAFILKHIDSSSLKQLLSTEVRRVLLAVFMKLNDLEHFKNLCDSSNIQLPTPTPLNIPFEGIQATLQYMQRTSPNPEECLLALLCKEYPNHIHFIMQNLLANISIATTTEIRFLCFHQYMVFCETLAHELDNISRMAGFVIWYTINALINLLTSDLVIPASTFLLRFLEFCLVKHCKYVDYMLDSLYPPISLLFSEETEAGRLAYRIKDLLVLKRSSLPRILSYLPLEETTASLEEEFNVFVRKLSPDLSALDRLSVQLTMRRKELSHLYDSLKTAHLTSSDEISKSIVHQLLAKLVTLATSPDTKIQTAAAKCLGQIGPRNLYSLALQPESCTAAPPLAEKSLSLLLPYIVHRDSEISEAASAAVTELLSTREGCEALGKRNSTEKTFFIPFLPMTTDCPSSISKEYRPSRLTWASCIRVLGSNSEGWAMWSGGEHSPWIRQTSSRLLTAFSKGLLSLMAPLAAKQTDIAEELLPYIIDIIVDSAEIEPDGLKIVQSNLVYFFKKHFELRNSIDKIEDDSLIYVNRKSVQCMLSIINFRRLKFVNATESERLQNLGLLNVKLLHAAYAAQFCRAYFTSLLYAELWVESIRSEFNSSSTKILLDVVCKKFPEDGRVLLNLLWEDYKELGERDSIEGCVRLQLGDSKTRIRYFREMGLWSQLVSEAELAGDREALSHGLLMSGLLDCLPLHQSSGVGWEAAWRLARWEEPPPEASLSSCSPGSTATLPSPEDFSYLTYSALRSGLHLSDSRSALAALEAARGLVLKELSQASLEVASSLYSPLAKLQLISETEHWCERREETDGSSNSSSYSPLLGREALDSGGCCWQLATATDWQHMEPLLWLTGHLQPLARHWLAAARLASHNSAHLIAQRFLQNAKTSKMDDENLLNEIGAEEAQAYWNSGNLETAKFILRNLLYTIEEPLLKAKCLLTYGTWMAETKSEGSKAIIEQYFIQAADLLDSREEDRLGAAECLAKFADSEYQRIHQYLSSPEYDMKKAHIDSCRRQLQGLTCTPSGDKTVDEQLYRSHRLHKNNIEVDEAEIKALNKEHNSYLKLAVREYLYCLQFERTPSDKMYRFVSLWLANKTASPLRKELDAWLAGVPSYRFIAVFPQLAVRVSPDEDHFARTLRKLLYRCAEDHPHHCLWVLLALSNAEFDKTTESESSSSPQPRIIGATHIVNELEKSKRVGHITESIQDLARAYISLANIELPKTTKIGDYKIAKQEKIRKFKDISHISCATMNIPIKKNADYSDIIGIVGFEDIFTIIGGINQPKKVKCLCTDGKKRIELVKGKDDPRQDALMQQVFSVLNTLLRGDKETSRRKLNIRTYKVVALTQRSGVIEWCQNTETLGSYLGKAHSRHRPGDLSPLDCRNRLMKAVNLEPQEKLKEYLQICAEFKPVMRHFFLERFPTPGVWYEKRLAYTRSVATNSMIGYVMGIGDRHVQNILIDNETAELIHIDFGVSFELGKILPTPETVPFRLTRDIEDGMGITGVEGVCRRCCEETMRVLRKRSEPVLTTLEMLLYDPLYSWTVKPRSEQSQQSMPDISIEETNRFAARFLQRLKLKLEGREEEAAASSVEAQVRSLILEAKDPKNISRNYWAWMAFF